jgi:hypothetical protein
VWRNLRVALLLLVLFWAATHTWLERLASTSWKEPLWIGIFPINADGSRSTQSYIDSLNDGSFTDIEEFMAREAHRYGLSLAEPVHVICYPQLRQPPPQLEREAGMLDAALWSLRVRWFAWRTLDFGGRAPPRIRLLVMYHDPATLDTVPDSHGLQKGLIGVAHVFANRAQTGENNIVIAHELLHTLGATDKYDPASGLPLVPSGLGDPLQKPLFPQARAEIMAGRRALSERDSQMPRALSGVVVGALTAAEIRWIHP